MGLRSWYSQKDYTEREQDYTGEERERKDEKGI